MTLTTYSISKLAAEFDITTRTIRFYEEKGLLQPTRAGTSRIYSPAERTKLKLILRGKRLGFTLEQSRDIIAMYDSTGSNVEQLQSLARNINQKRQELQVQLNDIKAMMHDLADAEEKCLAAMPTQQKKSPAKTSSFATQDQTINEGSTP
ncbi:MAG: MerR family DNA-binding transcriptional regulator [Halioglobus sp.]